MAGRRPRPEPSALERAVGLLARREHSQKELRRKLAARGVEAEDADAALARLAERGLQDDARFADMLIRSRISTGRGPQLIRAELEQHGITGDAIAAAFDDNAVDWTERARELIARRFTAEALADPNRRRKAIEFLLRRGFDLDTARAAVRTAD